MSSRALLRIAATSFGAILALGGQFVGAPKVSADYRQNTGTAYQSSNGTFWYSCNGFPLSFHWDATGEANWEFWHSTQYNRTYIVIANSYQYNKITHGAASWYACHSEAVDRDVYYWRGGSATLWGRSYWNTCCFNSDDSIKSGVDWNWRGSMWGVSGSTYPGGYTPDGCCGLDESHFLFIYWNY